MADEYEYKDPNTDIMKALSKAVDAATGETGTQYEYKNPNTDVIQKLEELTEAIANSGGGGGGGSSTLSGLTDVDLNSPTNGQVLGYDGTDWTNTTVGNASKQELTWSQYQQLSEEQKNNGTMYFCTDVNGDGSEFQPVIYSETEREIGVWTDGKPLYEKTVEFGALPKNTTKAVAHNISNIDHIWIYEGWAENNVNGFTNMLSLATNSLSSQWYFGVTPTEIQCWTGSDRSNYDTCYVILHYTKTTDQAGSGQWTPQGVPTIKYSYDEHIVGTWTDGSTVYEKTVSLGNLPNDSTLNVAHDISNLGKVISVTGVAQRETNFIAVFFPYATTNRVDTIFVTISQTNVNITTYSDRSAFTGYVTIQYTKSTS